MNVLDVGPEAVDAFAARVASGAMTPQDQARLQRGFAAWLNAGGVVPLELCVRVPRTTNAVRLSQRDYWVRVAFDLLPGSGRWLRAVELARQLDRFITAGPWRHWRGADDPPAGTGDLQAALFRVASASRGKPISADLVRRVVWSTCKN